MRMFATQPCTEDNDRAACFDDDAPNNRQSLTINRCFSADS